MEKNGLGKRLNAVRKDKGLTSDKLSEMCNVSSADRGRHENAEPAGIYQYLQCPEGFS